MPLCPQSPFEERDLAPCTRLERRGWGITATLPWRNAQLLRRRPWMDRLRVFPRCSSPFPICYASMLMKLCLGAPVGA